MRRLATLIVETPQRGPLRVDVYDLLGRRVCRLWDGETAAGVRRLHWDGRAADGLRAAPGLYLLRAATHTGVVTRALTLLPK